jgi:hypothetical protein
MDMSGDFSSSPAKMEMTSPAEQTTTIESKKQEEDSVIPLIDELLEIAKHQAMSSGGKSLLDMDNWEFGDTVVAAATSKAAWIHPNAKYVIDRQAGRLSVYVAEEKERRGTGSTIVGLGVPCWSAVIKQDKKSVYTLQSLLGLCRICKIKPVNFFSAHGTSESYCSLECFNEHHKASCKVLKLDFKPDPQFPVDYINATEYPVCVVADFIASNYTRLRLKRDKMVIQWM